VLFRSRLKFNVMDNFVNVLEFCIEFRVYKTFFQVKKPFIWREEDYGIWYEQKRPFSCKQLLGHFK